MPNNQPPPDADESIDAIVDYLLGVINRSVAAGVITRRQADEIVRSELGGLAWSIRDRHSQRGQ